MQNEITQPTSPLQQFSEKDIQRFWSKVNKDGPVPAHCPHLGPCWLWTGGKRPNGYGGFKILGRTASTHKFSFIISYGSISDGLFVCHKCDTKACVNPSHLFPGTQKQNLHDMRQKGRANDSKTKRKQPHEYHWDRTGRPGEMNGKAKLSEADVRFIRAEYKRGLMTSMGMRFNVCKASIGRVIRGESWSHI